MKTEDNLRDFGSLKKAYNHLTNHFKNLGCLGAYEECNSCSFLNKECSGGPKVAKIMKKNDN